MYSQNICLLIAQADGDGTEVCSGQVEETARESQDESSTRTYEAAES